MSENVTNQPIIKIDKLSKSFPGVLALDEVSLEVHKGEIHCLLGENGAGKSTLAECLYGSYKPDSGKIYFNGKEIILSSPKDAIKIGIGMVHQHFQLVLPMTVMENIVAGTKSHKIELDLKNVTKKVESICNNYGIELDFDAVVGKLTVGEQQWVEIINALYIDAKLLLLDEPTAVLTPQEIIKFFSILKKMTEHELSIILITHKLNEVMEISDRVTVLRKGKWFGTVKTSETTKRELAKMMVGRDVVFTVKKEDMEPGTPVIEIKGLYTVNDKNHETLKDINLSIRKNEILGLAGVSGNGQRELFDAIVGVQKPVAGKIIVNSENKTR